ncbi:MAG: hypothetical protein HY986_17600, partial [Candidatus Melainabacteria bacterium]|nr:hypothetical protein [Candidatus Melainabacteria bacterium]
MADPNKPNEQDQKVEKPPQKVEDQAAAVASNALRAEVFKPPAQADKGAVGEKTPGVANNEKDLKDGALIVPVNIADARFKGMGQQAGHEGDGAKTPESAGKDKATSDKDNGAAVAGDKVAAKQEPTASDSILPDWMKKAADSVSTTAGELADSALQKAGELKDATVKKVGELADSVVQTASELPADAVNKMKQLADSAVEVGGTVVAGVSSAVFGSEAAAATIPQVDAKVGEQTSAGSVVTDKSTGITAPPLESGTVAVTDANTGMVKPVSQDAQPFQPVVEKPLSQEEKELQDAKRDAGSASNQSGSVVVGAVSPPVKSGSSSTSVGNDLSMPPLSGDKTVPTQVSDTNLPPLSGGGAEQNAVLKSDLPPLSGGVAEPITSAKSDLPPVAKTVTESASHEVDSSPKKLSVQSPAAAESLPEKPVPTVAKIEPVQTNFEPSSMATVGLPPLSDSAKDVSAPAATDQTKVVPETKPKEPDLIDKAIDAVKSGYKAVVEWFSDDNKIKYGNDEFKKNSDTGTWTGPDGRTYKSATLDEKTGRLVLEGTNGIKEVRTSDGAREVTSKDASGKETVADFGADGKLSALKVGGTSYQFDAQTKSWSDADGKPAKDVSYEPSTGTAVIRDTDTRVQTISASGERVISDSAAGYSGAFDVNGQLVSLADRSGQYKAVEDPNNPGQKIWQNADGASIASVSLDKSGNLSIDKGNGETITALPDGARIEKHASGESTVTSTDKSGIEQTVKLNADNQPVEITKGGTTLLLDEATGTWTRNGELLKGVTYDSTTGDVKVNVDGNNIETTHRNGNVTKEDLIAKVSTEYSPTGEIVGVTKGEHQYTFDSASNTWKKDGNLVAEASFDKATGDFTAKTLDGQVETIFKNGEMKVENKAAGNLVTEFDADGNVKSVKSDYIGEISRQPDPNKPDSFVYVDQNGQSGYDVKKGMFDSIDITKPNGDSVVQMLSGSRGEYSKDATQNRWYDNSNNLASQEGPDGKVTVQRDGADGVKVEVQGPDGNAETFKLVENGAKAEPPFATYDKKSGELVLHRSADSSDTLKSDFSRAHSEVKDGVSTTEQFNRDGKLESIETKNGKLTSVADADGNIISAKLPDGSSIERQYNGTSGDYSYVRKTADGKTEPVYSVSRDGSGALEYNLGYENRKVATDGWTTAEDYTKGLTKTFNPDGKMTSMLDEKDGFEYKFKYDASGNLSEVTNRAGQWKVLEGSPRDPVTGDTKWERIGEVGKNPPFEVKPVSDGTRLVWEGAINTSGGEYTFARKTSDALRPLQNEKGEEIGSLYVAQNGYQYKYDGVAPDIKGVSISKDGGKTFEPAGGTVVQDAATKLPTVIYKDADGNVTSKVSYDSRGGATTVDGSDRILSKLDSSGNGVVYTRDAHGEATSVVMKKSGAEDVRLDVPGEKISADPKTGMPLITHADNSVTKYDTMGGTMTADSQNRLIHQTWADGTYRDVTWDGNRVSSSILHRNDEAKTVREEYYKGTDTVVVERNGAHTTVTGPDGKTLDISTTAKGDQVITGPNGVSSIIPAGQTFEVDKVSGAIRFSDASGNLNTTVAPDGRVVIDNKLTNTTTTREASGVVTVDDRTANTLTRTEPSGLVSVVDRNANTTTTTRPDQSVTVEDRNKGTITTTLADKTVTVNDLKANTVTTTYPDNRVVIQDNNKQTTTTINPDKTKTVTDNKTGNTDHYGADGQKLGTTTPGGIQIGGDAKAPTSSSEAAQAAKTLEQRAAEQKAAEVRLAEQRASDVRAAETKAAEQKLAEQKAAEQAKLPQQPLPATTPVEKPPLTAAEQQAAMQAAITKEKQAQAAAQVEQAKVETKPQNSPTPIDTKTQEQAKTTAPTPVDTKSQEQAKTTAPTPVDTKTPEQAKTTAPTPVDTKTQEQAKTTAPTPVDTKTQEQAKTTAPTPVDTKTQEQAKNTAPTPVDTKTQEQAKATAPTPVDTKTQEQAKATAPTPVDTKTQEQAKNTAPTPVDTKTQEQAKATVPTPVDAKAATAETKTTVVEQKPGTTDLAKATTTVEAGKTATEASKVNAPADTKVATAEGPKPSSEVPRSAESARNTAESTKVAEAGKTPAEQLKPAVDSHAATPVKTADATPAPVVNKPVEQPQQSGAVVAKTDTAAAVVPAAQAVPVATGAGNVSNPSTAVKTDSATTLSQVAATHGSVSSVGSAATGPGNAVPGATGVATTAGSNVSATGNNPASANSAQVSTTNTQATPAAGTVSSQATGATVAGNTQAGANATAANTTNATSGNLAQVAASQGTTVNAVQAGHTAATTTATAGNTTTGAPQSTTGTVATATNATTGASTTVASNAAATTTNTGATGNTAASGNLAQVAASQSSTVSSTTAGNTTAGTAATTTASNTTAGTATTAGHTTTGATTTAGNTTTGAATTTAGNTTTGAATTTAGNTTTGAATTTTGNTTTGGNLAQAATTQGTAATATTTAGHTNSGSVTTTAGNTTTGATTTTAGSTTTGGATTTTTGNTNAGATTTTAGNTTTGGATTTAGNTNAGATTTTAGNTTSSGNLAQAAASQGSATTTAGNTTTGATTTAGNTPTGATTTAGNTTTGAATTTAGNTTTGATTTAGNTT